MSSETIALREWLSTPLGRRCLALKADVTDAEQMRHAVAEVVGDLGRVDCLVNNAALMFDQLEATWDEFMAVNFMGIVHASNAVVPYLWEQQHGSIVNISSTAAFPLPLPMPPVGPDAAPPNVLLLTDSSSTAEQAQDEVKAGKDPNPYEGMLGVIGETTDEQWGNKSKLLQQCVDIYEKATGKTVPEPDESPVNAKGKKEEIYIAVADFCGELFMFRDIATRVGPDLTTKNWQKTVDKYGSIDLVSTRIASLCKGKYAADDAFRLGAFDSTAGDSGDWVAVTPIKDASGGKCTKVKS